jgi:hypothetical protein
MGQVIHVIDPDLAVSVFWELAGFELFPTYYKTARGAGAIVHGGPRDVAGWRPVV